MADGRPVMMPASAVLRVGDHAPVPLHGAPAADHGDHPGEVIIVVGYMNDPAHPGCFGKPVTITITSLEWAEDLESAARVAWAGGLVQGGMNLQAVR